MTNTLITKKEAVNYVDKLMYYCKEEGSFEQYEWGKQLIETGEAEITAENAKELFEVVKVLNQKIFQKIHSVMAFDDLKNNWKCYFTVRIS